MMRKQCSRSLCQKVRSLPPELTTIYQVLGADYETDEAKFLEQVEEDALAFKPYGKKIHEYTKRVVGDADGEEKLYEVWHVRVPACSLLLQAQCLLANAAAQAKFDTPGFVEYNRKMQLFILLYIEGGSYVDEDPVWEFVCLYVSTVSHQACS